MALICLNGIRFICAALQVWNRWTEWVHRKTWVSKLGDPGPFRPNADRRGTRSDSAGPARRAS